MKSILRYVYGRTRGWWVRVQWRGKTHRKLFSDSVYGSQTEALKAAIQWRDDKEVSLGKPRTELWVQGRPAGEHPGVYRGKRADGGEVWFARWPGGGTSYSIRRHGERWAFQLALEVRETHLAELYRRTR